MGVSPHQVSPFSFITKEDFEEYSGDRDPDLVMSEPLKSYMNLVKPLTDSYKTSQWWILYLGQDAHPDQRSPCGANRDTFLVDLLKPLDERGNVPGFEIFGLYEDSGKWELMGDTESAADCLYYGRTVP